MNNKELMLDVMRAATWTRKEKTHLDWIKTYTAEVKNLSIELSIVTKDVASLLNHGRSRVRLVVENGELNRLTVEVNNLHWWSSKIDKQIWAAAFAIMDGIQMLEVMEQEARERAIKAELIDAVR